MTTARFSVVVCGGGIAAVEGLLRLRRLAGDRVDIALVSPQDELVYRPMSVREPFTSRPVRRYPIARIAADADAVWERDSLSWVDRVRRVVHTEGGLSLGCDALLLAVGGRQLPSSPHMDVFTGHTGGLAYREILDGIERGAISSVAFVLPDGPVWPLPLFELALTTARWARDAGHRVQLHFLVPDAQPAEALGKEAGIALAGLLYEAGIALHTAWSVTVPASRRLVVQPSGLVLRPDRIVTLPTIAGPNVRGIPGALPDGYLAVDPYCRVHAAGPVFAAGDATDLSVKHGSVAAQQADTAAAGIAHLAGAIAAPGPVRPVVHATLFTGAEPLYLSAELIAGRGWHATVHERPPWPPEDKVVAAELGPYLRGLDVPSPDPLPS